jgi:CRP/FNR family transcriptional regulator, cyclic AMP receptor protein
MSAIRDQLAAVPLFESLNSKSLDRLEKIARTREFKPGDVIVKEGDEGVGFFLITSGKVDLTRGDTAIATLKQGQFFGEMALLDNHRRSATVTAVEPTTTIAMLRSDFVAELRANNDLALEMLSEMSRRVREADERLTHA